MKKRNHMSVLGHRTFEKKIQSPLLLALKKLIVFKTSNR